MKKGSEIYKDIMRTGRYEVAPSQGFDWLRIKGHDLPVSITSNEFDFIRKTIVENDLKIGYECATGTGVSSLGIGLAFKETGGKLVTMDSYAEEKNQKMLGYERESYLNTLGYRNTKFLYNMFDVEGCIVNNVGWSPENTTEILNKTFDLNCQKLDFVFIDALHEIDHFIKDVEVVVPYINKEKCFFFAHDLHCFDMSVVDELFMKHFNTKLNIVCSLKDKVGANLGLAIID